MGKPPEVPDLELPASTPSRRPNTPEPQQRPAPSTDDDDLFGGGIERGSGSLPPTGAPSKARGKQISVDFGARGDGDFEDALERGAGGSGFTPPSSSRAPVSSRAPASMNLDIAYKRPTAPAVSDEPGFIEKAGVHVLAALGIAGAVAPLLKLVHRSGRFFVMNLLPHAFDATSLTQSGIVAGTMLVCSIAFGYLGIKARPRSWAMIGSAFLFLLTALAMVTVALVATDENPTPPDGARLVPFTVPLAVILLGLGVSSRGEYPYFDGGAKRLLPFVAGLAGGVLVYAGIALSSF